MKPFDVNCSFSIETFDFMVLIKKFAEFNPVEKNILISEAVISINKHL